MKRIFIAALLTTLFLMPIRVLSDQTGGPSPQKLGTIDRNISYCKGGPENLLMDVYYPETANGPVPVAVYVHGGGWHSGSKDGGSGIEDLNEIRAHGYLVVSINYRLAPQYLFPAMIEDVKCAVRHLRANASTYGLNSDKIGVWGTSAGGHLVELLGTSDAGSGFEGTGGYAGVSSRVQAVVDMFGVADLPSIYNLQPDIISQAFGAHSASDPILVLASPDHWISSDDPPFLLLHGEDDTTVPVEQSKLFYQQLQSAGVESELVIVKNAGHGFSRVGGPIDPSRAEISKMTADFFDQHLK
ncbi:alpha/beta hydrolase [Candidatus Acetothermia bacterium]|nr:alpha/beta hydrolase [Candidatus Acetothermia bacterium]